MKIKEEERRKKEERDGGTTLKLKEAVVRRCGREKEKKSPTKAEG